MGYLIDHQRRDVPVPAPLRDWAAAAAPYAAEDYREKPAAFWDQVLFVRDRLPKALAPLRAPDEWVTSVVATHVSKSVLLPVYRIQTLAGLDLWLRNNHYDWTVSVASNRNVLADFRGLIVEPRADAPPTPPEGFKPDFTFGPYADFATEFTVTVLDDHALWAFCHLLAKAVAPRRWS